MRPDGIEAIKMIVDNKNCPSNCPYVYYSSEHMGCLNGRYGLIANRNEYLWLEDD